MEDSLVSENPGVITVLLDDSDDIKEEPQDLTMCQHFTYIPDDLCPPEKQTESDMPNMTKRLSMAWDLLKDIPGSIFISFIQDLCKNRPKAEIRDIIERLKSLISDSDNCEATDARNENKESHKNIIVRKKINRSTEGYTAKNPGPMKGKRELNAINRDLEYWRKVSNSFDSDTHNQKRRSSRQSLNEKPDVQSKSLIPDQGEATSQEDFPALVQENENSVSLCKIMAVESLSETSKYFKPKTVNPTEKSALGEHVKKDSNVLKSCMQSLQKSFSGPDRSRPSNDTTSEKHGEVQKKFDDLLEQYRQLLNECPGVLNTQDENNGNELLLPLKSVTKRKLPETEMQTVAKRDYVESTSPAAISVLNHVGKMKPFGKIIQLCNENSCYPKVAKKDTALKCKFCPNSNYIFKSRTGLQNHLLRHYKLRPMQCTLCGMTLHSGDGFLRTHEKKVHEGRKCLFTKTELPTGPPVCMDIPIPNHKRRKIKRYYD